jgi:hypothetical protein
MLTILFLASVWSLPPTAPQQSLMEQALDEPATIELTDVKLTDVFARVTEQTGVVVEMPPEVMALIPHGGETKLKRASIPNVPVRKGLTDLVGPLGMTIEVREDRVVVVPREALLRIGRPATWADLETLQKLARLRPGENGADLDGLMAMLQLQVDVRGGREALASAIRDVGAGPAEEVLSIATRNLGWSWRVDGAHVVIESVERQHRAQLDRSIDLRMNSRPLFDVLSAVGEAAGVPVRVDPGALHALPINVRQNFSVNLSNRTAEQALDAIAAYTGLSYLIDPEGVLFYDPAAGTSSANRPTAVEGGADPYVASMEIQLGDGQSIRWLIRASELPPELLERRREDIDRIIRALSDGFGSEP